MKTENFGPFMYVICNKS